MALILNPGPESLMEADAGTYYEGELLKEGTTGNRVAKTTAKGDEAFAVVCQTRIDPRTTTVEAQAAADKMRIFKLGTKATVDVKSIIGETYSPGCKIYLDASVSGQVTATDAKSARIIGHYPRTMATRTTTFAGQLVPCYLDVEPGASLTSA